MYRVSMPVTVPLSRRQVLVTGHLEACKDPVSSEGTVTGIVTIVVLYMCVLNNRHTFTTLYDEQYIFRTKKRRKLRHPIKLLQKAR